MQQSSKFDAYDFQSSEFDYLMLSDESGISVSNLGVPKASLMSLSVESMSERPYARVDLLVNPTHISYKNPRSPTFKKVRAGWGVEDFGSELEELDVSFESGGFISNSGLISSAEEARKTPQYKRILEAMLLFKNNGRIQKQHPLCGRYVSGFRDPAIYFLGKVFYGSYRIFNFEINEDKPFQIPWAFNFKVHQEMSVG